MSTIGDLIVSCLSRNKGTDEDRIATLLLTSKDARRMVLEDLRNSMDPDDRRFFSAVLELSTSEGEVESLTYDIDIVGPLGSEIYDDEPRIGDLIQSMYGSRRDA